MKSKPHAKLMRLLAAIGLPLALLALILLWLSWQAAPVHADPGTLYVAPTGSDTTDCTDPANPCRTVQYAVDQASSDDDEILVATGVYTDIHQRAGITQVVYISKTVTIRGGYTTTNWTTPYPLTQPTTLDAQGLGRVLVITGTITPTVEGLRITGGDATGLGGVPWGDDAGGGVYVYTATATISNCMVYSNTASTAGDGYGGGLCILLSHNATLRGNTIISNTASTSTASDGGGGGLYLYNSPAKVMSNTVQGNTASTAGVGDGGGLYLDFSAATLSGNRVMSNTASTAGLGFGGGLRLWDSDATLSGNTVQGNTASTAGLGFGGGLYLSYSDATLSGNTVRGNTASRASNASGEGGGLYLLWSDATLSGNTVQGNTASTAGAGGGGGLCLSSSAATLSGNTVQGNTASTAGVGEGGGLCLSSSAATLSGNTVQGNTASTADEGEGGGLYLIWSAATLSGNTVISNTATLSPTATGQGGGLIVYGSSPFTLTNNLVADNHANTQSSGLYFECWSPFLPTSGRLLHTTIADNHSSGEGVYVGPYTTLGFSNTIIAGHSSVGITVTAGSTATLEGTLWYGNGLDTGGTGTIVTGTVNVRGDPAFVDPSAWDYHLTYRSHAIDRGVDAGVTTDIDGEVRPQGGAPDIGADESSPPIRPVGGYVVPVNRLELLALRLGSGQAPRLGLAAVLSLAALMIALVRRRRSA